MITKENVISKAKTNGVYMDSPCYSKDGKFRMLKSNVKFLLSNDKVLQIKKGMYWDENSIPWIFQWAFPKSGIYAIPALIHDALYFDTTTSQEFADMEFKYWMEALGISKFQCKVRYLMVRLFGWKWWNKNLKNPGERCKHNRKLIIIKNEENN